MPQFIIKLYSAYIFVDRCNQGDFGFLKVKVLERNLLEIIITFGTLYNFNRFYFCFVLLHLVLERARARMHSTSLSLEEVPSPSG